MADLESVSCLLPSQGSMVQRLAAMMTETDLAGAGPSMAEVVLDQVSAAALAMDIESRRRKSRT